MYTFNYNNYNSNCNKVKEQLMKQDQDLHNFNY